MNADDIAAWQIDDTLEWTELYGEVPDPHPGWTMRPSPLEGMYQLRWDGELVAACRGWDAAAEQLRGLSADALIGHGYGPDFEGGEA